MRSEDDSCIDKVKELYPRLKFYHVKLENIEMAYPTDRYSNQFLNDNLNGHIHAEYLKRIEFYSPLGIQHFCSIK